MSIRLKDNIYVAGQLVWNAGNDGSGSGLDADLLDGFQAAAFVRSVNGLTPDASGAITINVNPTRLHNVRFDGVDRGSYGTVSVAGSLGGYAGIDFTAAGVTLMIGTGGGFHGFYKDNTSWLFYVTPTGGMWSSAYGNLGSYFFNNVRNCGNTITRSEGTGNVLSAQYHELIDEGGTIAIRRVDQLGNCNCNCNCQCSK